MKAILRWGLMLFALGILMGNPLRQASAFPNACRLLCLNSCQCGLLPPLPLTHKIGKH